MRSFTKNSAKQSNSVFLRIKQTETNSHLWLVGIRREARLTSFLSMITLKKWRLSRIKFIISVEKIEKYLKNHHWLSVSSAKATKSFSAMIQLTSTFSTFFVNMRRRILSMLEREISKCQTMMNFKEKNRNSLRRNTNHSSNMPKNFSSIKLTMWLSQTDWQMSPVL